MSDYHVDNAGHVISADVSASDPLKASSQALGGTITADTDTTLAVTGGQAYLAVARKTGGFYFSITGTTQASGGVNVEWAVALGGRCVIYIPIGVTTLHYAADTNDAKGHLIPLKNRDAVQDVL